MSAIWSAKCRQNTDRLGQGVPLYLYVDAQTISRLFLLYLNIEIRIIEPTPNDKAQILVDGILMGTGNSDSGTTTVVEAYPTPPSSSVTEIVTV